MDDPGKYETLKGVAQRATEKQPDEIRLIATPQYEWSNAAAFETYAADFRSLGFVDVETYTIDVLPVAIRFFLRVKESGEMYSTIYEHPKAGMWINLVVLYEDGTSITFTNTRDRGMEKRPGHPIVYSPGAAAGQLYSIAVQQSPAGARRKLSATSIIQEFEKAWADGVRWRKSRGGISPAEVASVIMSRGGQPTRVLRPERIQYIAEQDGVPERAFKAALKTIFDLHGGVEKAYLVRVQFDEAPEATVALCMVSPSRKIPFEDIRKAFATLFATGQHLDMMVIIPGEVPRVERVCAPFYSHA